MKGLRQTFFGFSQFGLGLLVVALVGGCGTEPPVPAAITISPESVTITDPGTLTRLVATVKDEDGRVLEGAAVDWSSSDSSVVTVSSDEPVGLVKVVGNGSASVSASAGPVKATVPVTVDADDRAVLLEFYKALGGDGWTRNANWGTEAPLDEWYGVTTDAEGNVTELIMGENGLTGMLPGTMGMLETLEILYLIDNSDMTGPIPPQIGDLPKLWCLALYYNGLTGPIPKELGNLAELEILHLSNNRLTGPIPPELGNLRNLKNQLSLNSNQLTGPIPPELGDLQNLEVLALHWNDLTGPIPPELGNLQKLRYLSLFGNRLTGPIPPELGNLRNLGVLYAGDNELTGSIPPELGNLRVWQLYLDNNDLTGPIPPELGLYDPMPSKVVRR